MWEPQFALADRGWRVIAPHVRGVGGGAGDPPASTMDDYAGDVVDLLDRLQIEDAVVGGVSMGGYLAFALLRHAPRYLRGLILADTRSQADTPEARASRMNMLQLVQEKGTPAVVDEMLPKLLGETTRRTRPDVVDHVRAIALENSGESVAGMIRALMSRPDSTPLLPSIHFPALVIVGEEDTLTPLPLAEQMQRAIAGSELVVIPAAGHVSNLEQPQAFNRALAGFLDHRV